MFRYDTGQWAREHIPSVGCSCFWAGGGAWLGKVANRRRWVRQEVTIFTGIWFQLATTAEKEHGKIALAVLCTVKNFRTDRCDENTLSIDHDKMAVRDRARDCYSAILGSIPVRHFLFLFFFIVSAMSWFFFQCSNQTSIRNESNFRRQPTVLYWLEIGTGSLRYKDQSMFTNWKMIRGHGGGGRWPGLFLSFDQTRLDKWKDGLCHAAGKYWCLSGWICDCEMFFFFVS